MIYSSLTNKFHFPKIKQITVEHLILLIGIQNQMKLKKRKKRERERVLQRERKSIVN